MATNVIKYMLKQMKNTVLKACVKTRGDLIHTWACENWPLL